MRGKRPVCTVRQSIDGEMMMILGGDKQPAAISRRQVLRGTVIVAGSATTLALAARPAAAKMTAQGAGYQDSPKGAASCANCTLFQKSGSCVLVGGTISPNGWC